MTTALPLDLPRNTNDINDMRGSFLRPRTICGERGSACYRALQKIFEV
jgi:hypothetical protein